MSDKDFIEGIVANIKFRTAESEWYDTPPFAPDVNAVERLGQLLGMLVLDPHHIEYNKWLFQKIAVILPYIKDTWKNPND